jgi:hypothetical protein
MANATHRREVVPCDPVTNTVRRIRPQILTRAAAEKPGTYVSFVASL